MFLWRSAVTYYLQIKIWDGHIGRGNLDFFFRTTPWQVTRIVRNPRWLPWPLIGYNMINLFSRTTEWLITRLARNVLIEVLKKYCTMLLSDHVETIQPYPNVDQRLSRACIVHLVIKKTNWSYVKTMSCSGSHLEITINIKNTKFVKDLPMIDAHFRFNQCNSFREEYISVFSPCGPVLILWPVVAAILDFRSA